MKTANLVLSVFCLSISLALFSQTSVKTERKIEKKIEILEENGIKTVKVETTEDGITTKEIHTGQAADDYLNRQEGKSSDGMFFKFDGEDDSLHRFNFRMDEHFDFGNFNIDSMMKNFHFEWNGNMPDLSHLEEELKKLEEGLQNFHFNMQNFQWNDSVFDFNNGMQRMIIIDDADIDDNTKEQLKQMGIDIDTEKKAGKKVTSKVIVSRIVLIEDIKPEKKQKELEDVYIGFYPNPGNGNFTLEFNIEEEKDEAIITIHDLTGKIVYTENVKGKGNYKKQISLDEPSGVYILKIQQGKRAITKKLIIQ